DGLASERSRRRRGRERARERAERAAKRAFSGSRCGRRPHIAATRAAPPAIERRGPCALSRARSRPRAPPRALFAAPIARPFPPSATREFVNIVDNLPRRRYGRPMNASAELLESLSRELRRSFRDLSQAAELELAPLGITASDRAIL